MCTARQDHSSAVQPEQGHPNAATTHAGIHLLPLAPARGSVRFTARDSLPSYPNSVPLRLMAEAAWEEPSERFEEPQKLVLRFRLVQRCRASTDMNPMDQPEPEERTLEEPIPVWGVGPPRVGLELLVEPHG